MRVFLCILVGFVACGALSATAQSIYSYIDEDGHRVITNIGGSRREVSNRSPAASHNYSGLVDEMAVRYDVSADLINAVIRVESDFDPYAVSVKNCKGLMQLHPDTARRFGVRDVFDPRQNVEGGVRYLSFLLDEFDLNLDHALAAYNSGEGTVRRYDGVPPYKETRNYVRRVRALLVGGREQPATTRIRLVEGADGPVWTNLPSSSLGSH